MIAAAILTCAAILSACALAPAPASNPNPSSPTESAPVAQAPTTAPTLAPTPTQPPAPTAAPTNANPQDVITKAMTALTSAKTIRLTVNTTSGAETQSIVMEYVSPDSFHVKQPNGDETIAIKGQGAYERKNGKWSKLPLPTAMIDQIISTVNPIAVIDKERLKIDQKTAPQVGADILNGKPMVTYQYNNPQGRQGYVKFWYGVADGWLYKFEGSDQTGKGDGTVEYNVPITIAPPL